MKRKMPGVFKKCLWTMMVLVSLLITTGAQASAAIPEELYLEVVTEPNHQALAPCQVNNQGQKDPDANPANGGISAHASHHPSDASVNGPVSQPVPFSEAVWLAAIKELNDSESYLNNLMEIFN